MPDIPTTLLVPTALTAAQTQEYLVQIVGNLSSENAHEMLARAYELGHKHGREIADAENALLLEATETVHNRMTDNTSAVAIGAVLHAFIMSATTHPVDGATCGVVLCSENVAWGDEYTLNSHDLGGGRTQFILHRKHV